MSIIRKQGKNKYVLIFSLIFAGGLLIGRAGISLYTGNNFNFLGFIALFIAILFARIFSWNTNEKRYKDVIEKQSQRDDAIIK